MTRHTSGGNIALHALWKVNQLLALSTSTASYNNLFLKTLNEGSSRLAMLSSKGLPRGEFL